MEMLDEYCRLAEASGLTVDATEDLADVTRPTFARWRENADLHRDAVVAMLGEVGWRKIVESCDVLESLWDDGALGYGLLAASRA